MSRTQPQLGLLGGLVLLATSLLGSSVFVVPALGAQIAGHGSLYSWLGLIAFMLPMAMVFGQLGRAYPHAGGVSHWSSKAMGPRVEWITAIMLISVIPVGLPAALLLTMIFLERIIRLSAPFDLIAQLLVLLAAYLLNRAGLRASALIQTLIILGTLLFIAALVFSTPVTLAGLTPQAPLSQWPTIASAAGLMLWCFLGLEIMANLAEEFKNPQRDIPWVVVGGVVLAGLVYYLCAAVVLSAPLAQINESSLLQVAESTLGPLGVTLLSIFGFLACFASLNTYLNGFSRGLWSLADEGKLPARLALRSHRQVPLPALNLIALVCLSATFIFYLDWLDLAQLITLANAHFILVYLAAMVSAIVLLTGLQRWVGVAGTLACLVGFASLGWAALYGLTLLAVLWVLAPKPASQAQSGSQGAQGKPQATD